MTYIFYLMSISVSLYGFSASDVSSFISLSSGTFLFGGLFFDAVGFVKGKVNNKKNRDSASVYYDAPIYGGHSGYESHAALMRAIDESPYSYPHPGQKRISESDPKKASFSKNNDALWKVKGNAYEVQIGDLLKKACEVFGSVNNYSLNVGSFELNPRGIKEKYDKKIDISFKVRDSFGRERVGAIQCKNWDSAYEAQSEYISSFLYSAASLESVFVHAFFVCNLSATTCQIDKDFFQNINFVTIPSKKRAARFKDESMADLISQASMLSSGIKKDFGVEFSLALVHARIYEMQEEKF